MDHLWQTDEPQTVRQVHQALSAERALAYTTVMTVLRRLAFKTVVVQIRVDRAHQYAAAQGRDALVAGLMADALNQAEDGGDRRAALVHFVSQVGPEEANALRDALSDVEGRRPSASSLLRLAN
jgi:predicted transcriptional regulator